MNDLFAKVEAFLTTYEAKAKDAATQGTAALRQLADYIDGQIAGFKLAGPDDAKKCADLASRCAKCCAECMVTNATPKGFGLPGNPILTILLQFLAQALQEFAQQQSAPTA